MKLSEFYGVEVSYNVLKTENGELYLDKQSSLYYRETSASLPVLLRTDVGEWFYLNDEKIICSSSDLDNIGDSIYICILDTFGNTMASGSLTQYGLIYTRDNLIIKEDSKQKETIIFELSSNKTPVMYRDESFSIPFYYPYSDFLYEKYYDYDENYLEHETKQKFLQKFLRELIYSFTNCPMGPSGLTGQQKKALDKLDDIRFGTTKITSDVVDKIISIAEEGNISDKYAVKGYQMIKKLFVLHGINDCLVKPMLNIMAIGRSGEFGRRSHKWISLVNAKRIETIAKKSRGDFKRILFDIVLLRENMSATTK